MLSRAILVLLFLCLSPCFAQTQFSSPFELRHVLMPGGFVSGTLTYSWDSRAIRMEFASQGYFEVYQYNTQRGFADSSVTDKPFLDQWSFKWGSSCTCQTAPVDAAMPKLFVDQNDWIVQGAPQAIGNRLCTHYTKNPTSPMDVTDLWIDSTTNLPCQFNFDDGREILLTNPTPTTPAPELFTPPDGCKCGKPVDLVVVLDRSGSISPTEFVDQKGFVTDFSENFSYGQFEAALSLVHFNREVWTTLTLREGTNPANVEAGVADLVCCNDPRHPNSCCCCGTSVSSGIRMGADQLATGREGAAHILVVITDGYHNHDINQRGCHNDPVRCTADLEASVVYAKSQVPDVIIYAVYERSDELLIVSDNHPERVIRRADFAALARDNLELVARACQENVNPCGNCCGFCSCGQCQAPDGCDAQSFCEENTLSGVCCKESPRICPEIPGDKCNTPICDEVNKQCTTTPVVCKENNDCNKYECNPQTGICESQALCVTTPQCLTAAECDDKNDCTVDICDPVTQLCKWEPVTCPGATMCNTVECRPQGGCITTPHPQDFCDDNSVCTDDVCDPNLGCINTPITCPDDGDLCTDETCDPFLGCRSAPKICPDTRTNEDESCVVTFCQDGACGLREVNCPSSLAVGEIAGIGAAAIVGIVVGIVLCLALIGGGSAYAYSQASSTGGVATVANNPIYVGSGSQGTNPLYQVG